jgi:four helix bundle protein
MRLLSQNSNLKSQSYNSKVKTDLRERCYDYSIKIIKRLETLPEKRLYWILSDQLLRSATSIGANVIEARSSSSKRDFIRFYEIALKSANETLYWLRLLKGTASVKDIEIDDLLRETEELSKIIAASILTMKDKR